MLAFYSQDSLFYIIAGKKLTHEHHARHGLGRESQDLCSILFSFVHWTLNLSQLMCIYMGNGFWCIVYASKACRTTYSLLLGVIKTPLNFIIDFFFPTLLITYSPFCCSIWPSFFLLFSIWSIYKGI